MGWDGMGWDTIGKGWMADWLLGLSNTAVAMTAYQLAGYLASWGAGWRPGWLVKFTHLDSEIQRGGLTSQALRHDLRAQHLCIGKQGNRHERKRIDSCGAGNNESCKIIMVTENSGMHSQQGDAMKRRISFCMRGELVTLRMSSSLKFSK